MKTLKSILKIFLFYSTLIIISVGCTSSSREPLLVGSFKYLEGSIVGLEYLCGSRTGLTDNEGKFFFKEGETIKFLVGDIEICDFVEARALMTPIDLVIADKFAENSTVNNIARFLQFLDNDQAPENGIKITMATRELTRGISINFSTSPESFESENPDLQSLKNTLNRTLEATAEANLFETLAKNNAGDFILINLGDNFTNGTQSGLGNVHKNTQIHSFPEALAFYMESSSNLTWENPILIKDTEIETVTFTREDETIEPYNLGVDGATTESLITRSETENTLLNELMKPIEINNDPVSSQLEAAKYLMRLEENQTKRNIITLWIGTNDILSIFSNAYWSNMTMDTINSTLTDTYIETIKENFTVIISELTSIDSTHTQIFIATLPNIRSFGALKNKTDIDFLATYDSAVTLADNLYIGFGPFIGSDSLNHDTIKSDYCIASKLDEDAATLNTVINETINEDGFVLNADEMALINARIKEINDHIKSLANTNENIFLVDLGTIDLDELENEDALFNELLSSSEIFDENGNPLTGIPIKNRVDPWFEEEEEETEDDLDVISRTFGRGFYSLDGFHPSHTGYGLIADKFIFAINEAAIGVHMKPVDIENIWAIDVYRDFDGDGFPNNPGSTNTGEFIIEESLKILLDCNDSNAETFPPIVNETIVCN